MSVNPEAPTAIEYVEWLLKHMLRTSRLELTVDTRRALPGAGEEERDGGPPCVPNAQNVINRLKVLAGLSPIRYAQSAEGSFERPSTGYILVVAARFLDNSQASTCAIRLRVRAKKA